MKKWVPLLLVPILLLFSVQVFAKALITVNIKAEKEVTVNKEKKMVAVKAIDPGDVVLYTINYVNSGDEAATNAFLDDPVPKGTFYLDGSAIGKDADVTFSIDGGKTFKKPSVLTYEVKVNGKMEKRIASPEQYTDIRWTVSVIPAHGSGQVGFKVRVK
ncbi:MAG: hypothetical protein WAU61_04670 [Smithella sp.]